MKNLERRRDTCKLTMRTRGDLSLTKREKEKNSTEWRDSGTTKELKKKKLRDSDLLSWQTLKQRDLWQRRTLLRRSRDSDLRSSIPKKKLRDLDKRLERQNKTCFSEG